MTVDVKARAAECWFGYGRWDAPYWFIGMEPGGDDGHASYEAWQHLGGYELIDCREHHLWKRDVLGVEDPKWTQWHEERRGTKTQPTWRRLIQLLLAFKNEPADLEAAYDYQKYRFGRSYGETAVIELGALHAPGLSSEIDRETHREARIQVIRERLREFQPTFVVCYGYRFRAQFSRAVGGDFDDDLFCWQGSTLCVLAPGPTSRKGAGAEQWVAKGRQIRDIVGNGT